MSRFLIFLCVVTISLYIASATDNATELVYNSFTSTIATEEEIQKYIEGNNAYICTKKIKECDPYGYRPLDGSCSNLDNPAVGAFNTPMIRLLPPKFGEDFSIRTMENGDAFLPERKCRTTILGDGKSSHPELTMLFGHFFLAFYADIVSVHDTTNYLGNTTTCCEEEGKDNPICAPLEVPEDDPVHRFSGLKCMNQTKPLTFQYYGCAGEDTVPTRIGNNTHAIDMNLIYYASAELVEELRAYEGGLLNSFEVNGIVLPPNGTSESRCTANNLPEEDYCFAAQTNNILGIDLIIIWFSRLHNVIATELATINPCWDDDKLFYETRQIVIASWLQIMFYEHLPLTLGREHMMRAGLISPYPGFRNIYNSSETPALSVEYGYSGRFFHKMQEGTVKMYNENFEYVNSIPLTNLTLHNGYFKNKTHLPMVTYGSLVQPFGGLSYVADPNMAEVGFGPLQLSTDILTNDLSKGRHYGLRSYSEYKKYFNPERNFDTWEDLSEDIDIEQIFRLMELYPSPADVELLAGLWSEKNTPNGASTPLMTNFMTTELKRMMTADRFWYENEDGPKPLTSSQLAEIRNVTAAFVMCTIGDNITRIQPEAFRLPGPGNEMCSCDNIPKLNLWAWKDSACSSDDSSE